jgi:hypothetical protein
MKKAIFYCLPVGAAGGAFLSLAGLIHLSSRNAWYSNVATGIGCY